MGNDQSNAAMPGVLREPSGTSQHPSLGIGLDPARVPTSTAVQEDTAAHQAVLKTVKGHHKKAYQLLNEALDQDQAKAIHRARQLYHEGLSAMQQGLEVDATGESPALLEARHLQAKMRANHEQIKARLDELNNQALAASALKPAASGPAVPRTRSHDPRTQPPHQPIELPKFLRERRSHSVSGTDAKHIPPAKHGSGKPASNANNLKNIDHKMAHRILNEIVDNTSDLKMEDVIGLEQAKKALHETIVLPNVRPDLFTGLRKPAKGILLFGPPGNGKTMLAKAVAASAKATFFNLSASSLTSKWVGEGEKLVRALFAMARELQPSIIFIDEIDSLLMARSSEEQESSRRMKTEILIQFEGLGSSSDDRVLVMGATNTPHELDTAAIRRFPIRIYVPMPDVRMRASLIKRLLQQVAHCMTERDLLKVSQQLEGYSASDCTALVREAAMGPIRALGSRLEHTPADQVRPVNSSDFTAACKVVRPSVPLDTIHDLEDFAREYAYSASS
eukprot:TRINITY_DN12260_c0_g2_i12.p1 TRINITY_DN12260_c0_g2~~TRINITY_DN12260_c0_g2_i12.p1  ORF type:complete len:506 (+),score=140.74 TRINITY_DN12260_c0_g2_i12:57-1574(+)